MARNYNNRVLRWVKISALAANLKYGFQSGLDSGKIGLFGQSNVTTGDLQGLVIGANNPKPMEAKRKFAVGWTISFCSYDKVTDLKAQGYQVQAPKTRTRLARSTNLSQTYYVTVNGVKYAWQMPLLGSGGANPAPVGARAAAVGDTDLVFGAQFPKPPRYKFTNESTGDTFNIFGDPSVSEGTAASAGFILSSSGRHTATDLALMLE